MREDLQQAPRFAHWLIKVLCNPNLVEEIQGDLEEFYRLYMDNNPGWKAKLLFWFHLLSFIRPYSIKKASFTQNRLIMFSHYLNYAIRFLRKHKGSTLFNTLSLGIGIGCFFFVFIYIQEETTFDQFHKDYDRIHRVVIDFVNDGERIPDATTPPALAPALKEHLPEIQYVTRIFPTWGAKWLMGRNENQRFYEEEVFRVDEEFLEVFDFNVVLGDRQTMLSDPSNIVLTERMARKYFGDENPLGQELTAFNRSNAKYVVSGVIEDVPYNSHFSFDFLALFHLDSTNPDAIWGWYNFYTYVKLHEGASPILFEEKLQPLYDEFNVPRDEDQNIIYSQPIKDIHLYSNLKWELGVNNSMSNIQIFVSIGICILLISAINYLNLSLGSTLRRIKEVGIRKSFGADKGQLVGQFATETLVIVFLALVLGAVLSEFLFQFFQDIFGRRISLFDSRHIDTILLLSSIVTGFGMLTGLYPALRFSSFSAITQLLRKRRSTILDSKNVLLIFQFSISVVMIVATLVVFRQLSFFKNSDKGFNMNRLVVLENARSLDNQNTFLNELEAQPGVGSAALSDGVLGQLNWTTIVGYPERFQISYTVIDPSFLDVMEMNLLAGRNFDKNISGDREGWNLIVNEAGLKNFGLEMEEVGESFVVTSDEDSLIYGKIIGVVQDFHFTDFKSEIKPYAFFYRDDPVQNVMIKIDGSDAQQTMTRIESLWQKHAPGVPFETYFMDQSFGELHEREAKLSEAMTLLTFLSLFISFTGMLAIVNIVIRNRMKEVAVRKVLGASVSHVVNLISRQFILLVLVANIIGIPLAYFGMQRWLNGFSYRTHLEPWLFIFSLFSTLLIAYLVVGYGSMRAATLKITDRLREN